MTQPTRAPHRFPLAGWTVQARPDATGARPTRAPVDPLPATVPGTVHMDLLRHGVIPDPYDGLNELEVQWVGETAWEYAATFELGDAELDAPHLDLCLDGLDTVCTASVNGTVVLRSENMFVPHRIDVRPYVQRGRNSLSLHFDPVMPYGRALEAEHGKRAVWNGDASRVYVRKAQYHYGWDWGPTLLTAGPWQDVTLHAYAARLDDVRTALTVADDLQRATLTVEATVGGTPAPGDTVDVHVVAPDGRPVAQLSMPALAAAGTLDLPAPALWWPRGYGEQPLYTVTVTLRREDAVLDRVQRRVGARRLELVQEGVAGEPGTSFTFVVNGVPVFAGGANWIPEDLLLNRVTPDRYRARLQQAADAHMVMIRVWGGGIYEPDVFYDVCDELGLLVWQDFLFACGLYPAHPAFLDSVRAEAIAAVTRLRHHACLALWCGNNEDYQIAESVGAAGPGADPSAFAARSIYERMLPEVVRQFNPEVPYWPGSPSGGASSSDPTIGDRHTWEVWHGVMAPHQDYGRYEGRFVSEFGLQSPPSLHTIASFTRPQDRRAHGRVFEHHNKAADPRGRPDGSRRLAAYLSDTFQPARTFEEYVYHARLVQADAMASAYRAFRGRWGHDGARAVSGALVWQLNDCWPATSWAIVDVDGVPKPAYHAIRRELAPLAVQARREGDGVHGWVVSSALHDHDVTVQLDVHALGGDLLLSERHECHAAANAVTPLDLRDHRFPADAVVVLRLLGTGQDLGRAALWPEPLKQFDVPDPGLSVTVEHRSVSLHAARPARGVWVDAGSAVPSDNHLDLLPGERVRVVLDRDVAASNVSVWAVGSEVVRATAPVAALRR
ncbi:beta-mannosidase [Deinococcus metalli]|uniref:Beta-mannosidase B n=1 Tax=Deinococcus metalli TaxID=1141878 RepID=A0A7W8KGG1_9DEIO|nr:glycoside hydrolase family 2 protein [Deinococcus metalli]MBB5376673.1 beta-mannosidase [Deinococcus metalli]GHF42326.1 beta-mannosidase [Deinococcus metalli]